MQIGILGGTGPAGSGLATRLASVGHDVVVGSRSAERAGEVVDGLHARWEGRDLSIAAADNAGAAEAELIVVATPWDAAWTTAKSVRGQLAGKIVLSMANALVRVGHEFQPLVPPRGSVAASVQAAVPDSEVVAALHHVPAKELGDLDHPVESDVLICSDHPEAKARCMELLAEMHDLRPLDAGDLTQAAPIEAFTAVLLQLNVRYKTRVAVKFTGLDDI
ncbi:NADPH-dependent F420 reductase [Rhabdothermincola salaria]|uniref:NADPH-dependent F420 reductase n=1 Tax=Rhabdothermincola salaria TaxID=2903142 RepID=UPI001E2DBFE6|nr:NADPH-dependent F420 reductase [Rhabdothermincola salaria]MCD9622606.1 NADPH-dependent F420 reductase [Rhabdothermincola salaria]